ncbi:hypothetical protein QAD02_017001 [Eretmocerus hayati]|uniref:Uncharacterized protein n=1 Tax=Eretmocerus hayati TaxID=131215 RepID=A0ACC2PF66_9HYME|nr:hypothetical protein QAD02_017001 [Eretmocerus hayati]
MTCFYSFSSHGKEVCDRISDNGGLYDMSVKKMLQPGHEGELCAWLKEFGLIRPRVICSNESCNNKSLNWSPARSIDKYGWTCSECKKKQSIRDNSFFWQIKCDLKLCMQIIAAWCQDIASEVVASYLDMKHHLVKKVYEKLEKVAETFVKTHLDDWILGGNGNILIVDEYPGGYMTENLLNTPVPKKRNNNNSHTVLCLAEIESECPRKIPPRMWMHIIQANPQPLPSKNSKNPKPEGKCGMVEEALNEIRAHAKPGSYLIANKRARSCSYESLKELKDYHVISIEDLQMYDTPGKSELLSDLETIWQTGIGICEDIQETTKTSAVQYLYVHLWRQKFATSSKYAFIMQHIAECYQFT